MSRERKNDERVECPKCGDICNQTIILRLAYECKKCGLIDVIDRKDIDNAVRTAAIDAVREIIKIIHSQKCYDDGSGYLVIDKSDLIYDIKTRWRELKDGT